MTAVLDFYPPLPAIGDVNADGYTLQDGDCPSHDPTRWEFIHDDGGEDSHTVCGVSDGDAICCGRGRYTAWFGEDMPVALCAAHAAAVRLALPRELTRMHTARPDGQEADWSLAVRRREGRREVTVVPR